MAFEFDATDCPDLFPPLAALAANCKGTTKITGVHRLTHKESNRALTIQEELEKMNIKVDLNDNVMMIEGTGDIKAATVHSHHDHRIAMMCAVLALNANGKTTIEEAEAINKSYPDFYNHLTTTRRFFIFTIMNSFGRIFRVNIFGESHGESVGVNIDGIPAGLSLTVEDFLEDIERRKGGTQKGTTPRQESLICLFLKAAFSITKQPVLH